MVGASACFSWDVISESRRVPPAGRAESHVMVADMTERIVDFLARHAVGIFGGLGAIYAFHTSAVVLLAFSVRYKAGRFPRWALFRLALVQPYRDPEEAYRRPGALLFAIMVAGAGLLLLLGIVVVE